MLIIAFLALVHLFAPLVHAHTGDSRQNGVHMHIPGAGQDDSGAVLTADPGMEIGIESMRRESASVAPEADSPYLIAPLPNAPEFSDCSYPLLPLVINTTENRFSGPNPPRGPPAAAFC